MVIIYKITHRATGLIYIGRTDHTLKACKKEHLTLLARKGHDCTRLQELYNNDNTLDFKAIEALADHKRAIERELELIGANYDKAINTINNPEEVPGKEVYRRPPTEAEIAEYIETTNKYIQGRDFDLHSEHIRGPLAELREKFITEHKRIWFTYYA